MAGRPPKPTALKLLQGNPGKRPLPESEPVPPPGDVKPPAWLKGKARTAWKWVEPVLSDMGVLTTADPHALALLCDAYAEYIEAGDAIREHGTTYETVTKEGSVMFRSRPEVAIRADAWRRVSLMMQQFGMTPSSRAKVQGQSKESVDPFEEFLSGGRNTG